MPIKAKTPVTEPARAFDNVWIAELAIRAPEVNGNATVSVMLKYYDDNGNVGPQKNIFLPNVLERIKNGDKKLAAAYQAIMAAVAELEAQDAG